MALHQFPQFSNFPRELQLLVWEEAANLVLPRVIELELQRQCHPDFRNPRITQQLVSRTPAHPLLHTCQDSRQTMLRNWPLKFGTAGSRQKARVQFNSDIDILFLHMGSIPSWKELVYLFTEEDCQNVKSIAFRVFCGVDMIIKRLVEDFPNLRTIFLIQPEEYLTNVYVPTGRYLNERRSMNDTAPNLLGLMEIRDRHDDGMHVNALELEELANVQSGRKERKRPAIKIINTDLSKLFIGIHVDSWGNQLGKAVSEAIVIYARRHNVQMAK